MDRIDREDIEAWEPDLPPDRFAEEVVRVATRRRERRGGRGRALALACGGAAVLLGAAAAAWAVQARSGETRGEVVAQSRREVRLGKRAVAVVEPGAHLAWQGDRVEQSAGEVFYRVEPGATFRVHTSAGDVTVKGTCFDVAVRGGEEESGMTRGNLASGAVGMVAGAMVFVGVYEGKVALSQAAGSVDVAAGQGARAGGGGIHGPEPMAAERAAFDGAGDDPLLAANANLVSSIDEYKRRLDSLDAEKKQIEKRLEVAEHKLSVDGGTPQKKSHYDLGPDDWKRLATRGEIRYLIPGSKPGPKELANMGLAPAEEEVVLAAHQRSYARTWGVVEPLCTSAVGSPALADKLGMGGCVMVVMNAEGDVPLAQAMRQVSAIRAGLLPMPNEVTDPAAKMFLTLTAETKLFEAELAQSLGPAEAWRLAYQDDTAMLGAEWLPDD